MNFNVGKKFVSQKKSHFQILQEKILWKIVKDTRKQITVLDSSYSRKSPNTF